ncbi:rod shape-determining protein MreD [Alkalilimnicola ehrlichii]|uniref:Rod shape-determining protein MreD n=1 Tax=Alkalilimnicola ehrlichii TaxID=351052 RepID=A0A3E0X1B4_9GAMM|nr:rod shape-determining protein MreD [Alkalilimnicola ehrlichii]RFA31284.1 rod shape-determining protein MreD [Alkalilimnicola ehrlichii]RFA39443.1 rod shape-determining protein MreD [Alkalilimnicola ehrlichii]
MSASGHQGGWTITASFVIALMLTVVPLPEWAAAARPQWVALVLIYWCMALPQRVGVGIGFIVGFMQDALLGSLLGQHALAFALLAFLTMKLHQRIRVFPLWQQALTVLVLLLLTQLILFWINGLVGRSPTSWTYWLAPFTGTVLWPWVFVLMRELRRNFNVR